MSTVTTDLKQGHKLRRSDNDSKDIPSHILRQSILNKTVLAKVSSALHHDPAADLTALLSDVSASYASKRRTASEPRPLTRKGGKDPRAHKEQRHGSFAPPPTPKLIYPLAASALTALGLSERCSMSDMEFALKQLSHTLEGGETLHNLFGCQITCLDGRVVVKSGRNVDPAEHCLLAYLQKHCPSMRAPEPLGFVALGHQSYLFMSRIPGVTLHSRWPSMSDIQKESVCSQLDAMLSDLHSLSWTPGTPLGSLTAPHTCKDARLSTRTSGAIHSESEFNDFLLRNPRKHISPSYMKWLRSCLVDDHRIVLSHGDLNPKNIILLDGKDESISVSGIIDWEMGGWYPEYWDALKALNVRGTDDDSDWWCSLPPQLNRYITEVAIDRLIEAVISGT
ncbi:putative phosphotransferase enzyme family protein [Lyophyllum shimeji]|uniref:Phosphotransferase enzyme family protein n=1 Tax=Lyophyllum shimeji TaxID=47721 RepID=A0A9P3UP14_LYOSH|nr:putative phosphotransferase enzyme family protein [Lyophyllum shimeji]